MRGLRQWTPARVALGRAGNSLPTRALLDFQLAHALARDAVHECLDVAAVRRECEFDGLRPVAVRSLAGMRAEYLKRPDLGRHLAAESAGVLARLGGSCELAIVVADGLSALAVQRHAVPLLRALIPLLPQWTIAPVAIVEQGRVAIGDEIGRLLGASLVLMLIGERPGLSSPDSLSAYLTWNPTEATNDASRNCISNIRPEALGYEGAALRLAFLMNEARRRKLTGASLKEYGAKPQLDRCS